MRDIIDLCNTMDYNLSREKTGESRLADIQMALTNLFFKKTNLTQEEIETFAANLYTNPQMFNQSIKYNGLDQVANNFTQKLEQYKSLNTSMQK